MGNVQVKVSARKYSYSHTETHFMLLPAPKTSTEPNSRAVISLWRRCFELREQQEEEKLEEIVRALEAEISEIEPSNHPIRSKYAAIARAELLADYYRDMMTRRQPTVNEATTVVMGTNTFISVDSQMMTNTPPSLLVPRHDGSQDFIYLPQ